MKKRKKMKKKIYILILMPPTESYVLFKNQYEKVIKKKNEELNELINNGSDKKTIENKKRTIRRPGLVFDIIPEDIEVNEKTVWNIICKTTKLTTDSSRSDYIKRYIEIQQFEIDKNEKEENIKNIYKEIGEDIQFPKARVVNLSNYAPKDLKYKPYENFIRNLLTSYPCLRSDYYNVKLVNFNEKIDNYYKDGVIHFNKLLKKYNSKAIKLNQEDIDFIEYYMKYNDNLFDGNNDEFALFIRKIEKKGVNFYRHLCAEKFCKELNLSKEDLKKLLELANDMNTSLNVIESNYLNNN